MPASNDIRIGALVPVLPPTKRLISEANELLNMNVSTAFRLARRKKGTFNLEFTHSRRGECAGMGA
jgi:hypothetical protein